MLISTLLANDNTKNDADLQDYLCAPLLAKFLDIFCLLLKNLAQEEL